MQHGKPGVTVISCINLKPFSQFTHRLFTQLIRLGVCPLQFQQSRSLASDGPREAGKGRMRVKININTAYLFGIHYSNNFFVSCPGLALTILKWRITNDFRTAMPPRNITEIRGIAMANPNRPLSPHLRCIGHKLPQFCRSPTVPRGLRLLAVRCCSAIGLWRPRTARTLFYGAGGAWVLVRSICSLGMTFSLFIISKRHPAFGLGRRLGV